MALRPGLATGLPFSWSLTRRKRYELKGNYSINSARYASCQRKIQVPDGRSCSPAKSTRFNGGKGAMQSDYDLYLW